MNKTPIILAVSGALGLASAPLFGAEENLDALRQQIEQLRRDYETRIQALEQRLEQAEQQPKTAEPAAPPPPPPAAKTGGVSPPGLTPLPLGNSGQVTSGTAFNPALSIIMDGVYYHDNQDGEAGDMVNMLDGISGAHGHDHDHGGHDHGHAHGSVEQGFNLRNVELAASASVDPYFDARAQIVFSEDGVELEEAYFLTRRLPAGLQLKGGKFLSDIGYINNQHPHSWDFGDQNLPYQVLLGGHGLMDSGLQLTWLPDWDLYTRFGMELFQGDNEKMGALVDEHHYEFGGEEVEMPLGEKKTGPRMWTLFGKFSPDLGYDHALQGGLFYARSRQYQELHGDNADAPGDQTHALQGKSWLLGTDWVYKYDSPGAHGQGDFRFQAEYLYQVKDLNVAYHGARAEVVGDKREFTEDGLYFQGIYGFAPRWEAGLRYDVVGLTNQLDGPTGTLREWNDSDRWSLVAAFRPTEYSVLRAQFSRSNFSLDGESRNVNAFWLQYQLSLGVHGAHAF